MPFEYDSLHTHCFLTPRCVPASESGALLHDLIYSAQLPRQIKCHYHGCFLDENPKPLQSSKTYFRSHNSR